MAGMATVSTSRAPARRAPGTSGPEGGPAEQGGPGGGSRHTDDAVRGRWPAPGTIREAWTAADLESLPDDGLRYEIIDGVLLVTPSPLLPHQRVSHRLAVTLDQACPAGMEVFEAPLDWAATATTVFEPDLLVVRREDATGAKLVGTPLLAVEIASPSTANIDRTLKFNVYAQAGVGQYWIVDPGSRGDGSGGSSGDDGPGKRSREPRRAPSIEVYDLAESGGYELQVRAAGGERVSVAGPVPIDVIPAELIA